jgi:hypothetical protein
VTACELHKIALEYSLGSDQNLLTRVATDRKLTDCRQAPNGCVVCQTAISSARAFLNGNGPLSSAKRQELKLWVSNPAHKKCAHGKPK